MSSMTIISSVFQSTELPTKINLNLLYDIMLSKDKMDSITSRFNLSESPSNKKEIEPITITENEVSIETKKDEYIEPRQHDTLFWCLYIIHHGYDDYMQIDRNYGVKEI